uniref:Uncharacterized protein n=1 Tax=Brassica oleracea TaxID=3712 RepID=A0A3P6G213_BRAOL|nr:unnamed protein product [Brassica oleracea]
MTPTPNYPQRPHLVSLKRERERERERAHQESSPEPPHARTSSSSSSPSTAARVNLVHPRPSSCSSRQDEAVDTNRVTIGARTKPSAPPEVHLRVSSIAGTTASALMAPPPDHRSPRRSSAVAAANLPVKLPPELRRRRR